MKQAIKRTGLVALSLLVVSPAFAGDTNTSTSGTVEAFQANSGIGGQVIDSLNSNAGNRASSDIVMTLGDTPVVANAALEASISENGISVSGANGSANTALYMTDGSGFRNMAGVNAIAMSSGHNSSQHVSVNVTAAVTTDQVVTAPAGSSAP